MKVLLTGAAGFLGWHTRVRLHATTAHTIVPVIRQNWSNLPHLAAGVDAVLHVAGVNRGDPVDVESGNVALAADLAAALRAADTQPKIVVYANSTQSGNGTAYGSGKAKAGHILADVCDEVGATLVDLHLPNLFGEHGRPHYNSFVQTFAHGLISGEQLDVDDRPITLLHAQEAAAALISSLTCPSRTVSAPGLQTSVADVLEILRLQNVLYSRGEMPPLSTNLEVDLFNTLRAARFPDHYPGDLPRRVDERGALVEAVRAHHGQGQTFVSTTKPGYTRGEHFHLRKVERFIVLHGHARISLRRVCTNDVATFNLSGDAPCFVDMPTLWAHDITNTGTSDLTTLFWTNELFDPEHPDTFRETVHERDLCLAPTERDEVGTEYTARAAR